MNKCKGCKYDNHGWCKELKTNKREIKLAGCSMDKKKDNNDVVVYECMCPHCGKVIKLSKGE